MSATTLRGIAIGCFVLCAILLFVAFERYQANAQNVEALRQSPFGNMMPVQLEPATPAATKYALLFAVLSAAGGVVCLVVANKPTANKPPE